MRTSLWVLFLIPYLSFGNKQLCAETGRVELQTTPLIVARVTDVTSALGTTWHSILYGVQPDRFHDEMQNAGIKWYRSFMDWDRVEVGRKKNYVFPSYRDTGKSIPDALLYHFQSLKNHGIRPFVALLYGNPLYGNYAADGFRIDSARGLDYLSPEGYADFCGEMAKRYKQEVQYWELGNEPHNGKFGYYGGDLWSGKKWIPHFVKYFNIAAKRIKQLQPEAKILSPGDDDPAAMSVYLPQIAPNVDILAIHPYADMPSVRNADPTPEGIDGQRLSPYIELARKNNIKEIWITEIGWTVSESNVSAGRETSEIGQAKYLLRGMFFYPLSCSVKVFSQYCWEDGDLHFYMYPTSKLAYQNIHSIFKNAVENVSIDIFNQASVNITFISNQNKELESKVEKYLLVKNKKTIFFVYWLRLPQKDDFQKQDVKITLNFGCPLVVVSVKSYDILKSSQQVPVVFKYLGKNIFIKDATITDSPCLLEISLK
jgi:hypothetical protein